MNVLVSFLREHSEAVDRLTGAEQSSVAEVVDATEGFDFPFIFDHEVVGALTVGAPNGHLLRKAYLPVIERDDWDEQLRSAVSPEIPESTAFAVSEHVTMVAGRFSGLGVTLPDDDD
jgi:hypothetical protein